MLNNLRCFEGLTPRLAAHTYIDLTAAVIGDVVIGEDSSVWPMVVIRGDVNYIRIGERTSIQDGSILHVTHAGPFTPAGNALIIGSDVTIGHQVILHGCTIEDECLIGMGSKLLDGAVVQRHVLLGAGSLVPPGKIVESGYLWMGTPVKKIRPLTTDEISFFKYSAQHYVKLKNRHMK